MSTNQRFCNRGVDDLDQQIHVFGRCGWYRLEIPKRKYIRKKVGMKHWKPFLGKSLSVWQFHSYVVLLFVIMLFYCLFIIMNKEVCSSWVPQSVLHNKIHERICTLLVVYKFDCMEILSLKRWFPSRENPSLLRLTKPTTVLLSSHSLQERQGMTFAVSRYEAKRCVLGILVLCSSSTPPL